MTARGHHRGYPMYFDGELWRYEDGGGAVMKHWMERPCGRCEELFTPDGHDPCIANLPGVRNACCGHGNDAEAYVQFDDGRYEVGSTAIEFFQKLRAEDG